MKRTKKMRKTRKQEIRNIGDRCDGVTIILIIASFYAPILTYFVNNVFVLIGSQLVLFALFQDKFSLEAKYKELTEEYEEVDD